MTQDVEIVALGMAVQVDQHVDLGRTHGPRRVLGHHAVQVDETVERRHQPRALAAAVIAAGGKSDGFETGTVMQFDQLRQLRRHGMMT